jgi:hypothetical protein
VASAQWSAKITASTAMRIRVCIFLVCGGVDAKDEEEKIGQCRWLPFVSRVMSASADK